MKDSKTIYYNQSPFNNKHLICKEKKKHAMYFMITLAIILLTTIKILIYYIVLKKIDFVRFSIKILKK